MRICDEPSSECITVKKKKKGLHFNLEKRYTSFKQDFPSGSDGKASAYNVGDLGSIPGWRRSPGEGNGNPLEYSCLENPMDGGTW